MTTPGYRTPAEREDALRNAVRGLLLDANQELMLAGFAHSWSADLTERVCTLFEMVREAGYLTRLVEQAPARPLLERGEPGMWVPGNSGPGF